MATHAWDPDLQQKEPTHSPAHHLKEKCREALLSRAAWLHAGPLEWRSREHGGHAA